MQNPKEMQTLYLSFDDLVILMNCYSADFDILEFIKGRGFSSHDRLHFFLALGERAVMLGSRIYVCLRNNTAEFPVATRFAPQAFEEVSEPGLKKLPVAQRRDNFAQLVAENWKARVWGVSESVPAQEQPILRKGLTRCEQVRTDPKTLRAAISKLGLPDDQPQAALLLCEQFSLRGDKFLATLGLLYAETVPYLSLRIASPLRAFHSQTFFFWNDPHLVQAPTFTVVANVDDPRTA
jgi:hypothetical protein